MSVWQKKNENLVFNDPDNKFPGWHEVEIYQIDLDNPPSPKLDRIRLNRFKTEKKNEIPLPIKGMCVWDIDTNTYDIFTGVVWENMSLRQCDEYIGIGASALAHSGPIEMGFGYQKLSSEEYGNG